LKPAKCHFAAKKLKILGHIISEKGVAVNPAKMEAVEKPPVPIDKTKVHEF